MGTESVLPPVLDPRTLSVALCVARQRPNGSTMDTRENQQHYRKLLKSAQTTAVPCGDLERETFLRPEVPTHNHLSSPSMMHRLHKHPGGVNHYQWSLLQGQCFESEPRTPYSHPKPDATRNSPNIEGTTRCTVGA